MNKTVYLLLTCLLFLACSKQSETLMNSSSGTANVATYELLWGKWDFSYVTNTMEGTRSYTFLQDERYSYHDEWTVRDAEWNILSQEEDQDEGTYSVPVYKKEGNDAAEGEIMIGNRRMAFSIAKDATGNTQLTLNGNESYTKRLSTP